MTHSPVVRSHPFRLLAPLVVAVVGVAQQPTVGSAAPAIAADSWLNWDGEAPTLASLQGRVVLLEFWGTWCGPCVRAMPGIQKLHERYKDRGLTVLAITYEPAATVRPFLAEHGYTMAVGSDPSKQTISAYGIRGWPTTYVLDREGKIAHVGSPYDAETAVERALGLEAGPVTLLSSYLETIAGRDTKAGREALERLVEKAPHTFDLRAWAKGHVAGETVGEGSDSGRVATPAAAVKDAGELLRRCAEAWGDEARRTPLLEQLATGGPADFDLTAFARARFAAEFPLELAELKAMLKDKKYGSAVAAIVEREPSAKVLSAAAKDRDLAKFCAGQADDATKMAHKGMMAALYLFPGALPKDEKVNSDFFRELAVSGFATSEDKKRITGVMLGGELVTSEQVAGYVDAQLGQALVMASLGDGKAPKLRGLDKLVEKQRTAIERDLAGRYGKPEPRNK
ncbi:MAG: TlpA family protein disulfide reductase [Planctomycetes bacterium]|nr:TlpA family protein disulfide reductase [Planctomycetota bacterium]